MVAAALKTASNVGATIGGGASINSVGLVEGVYSVTIVTTKDWVILSDFTAVKYVSAYITATGVDAEAYIDGTTLNKVYITGTGACTLIVKGTKA